MTTTELLIGAGAFAGGLGLFLLAVGMLTDGLRIAAGEALRGILASGTRTPVRGVASGVLVTAIVQSSSAVTVATIGFVNAGLLSLRQALGVVYGANIGTTITGWLVAAVGFDWDIDAFALPMIGLGMLLRLVGASRRLGAAGEAIAGFGLFFVGVDVLRGSFEALALGMDPASLAPAGWLGLAAFFGVGVMMTVLTQSSSAAIAITLTAATGGMVSVDVAAAAVIGANVGTTSTAMLAALGATSAARRVASAHVLFNILTGLVALGLLPLLLWLVDAVGRAAGLDANPAVSLALFHTVFNVVGVMLMLPVTRPLARFLEGRFVTSAERLGRPRHLDVNVAATPALALDALAMELQRLLAMVRDWLRVSAAGEADEGRREAIEKLSTAIVAFLPSLERSRMPEDMAAQLPTVLRVVGYVEEVLEAGAGLDRRQAIMALSRGPAAEPLQRFLADAFSIVADCVPEHPEADPTALRERREALKDDYHLLKDILLALAAEGGTAMDTVSEAIDVLRDLLRVCEQLVKACRRVCALAEARPLPEALTEEAAPLPDGS